MSTSQPHPSPHRALLLAAARAGQPVGAGADRSWPTKPVTIVVPFPAGGGTDAFARPLSAVLTQEPRQTIHHRQQGRCRRHRGRRRGGASRTRRLHLLHGRGAPRDRAVDVPKLDYNIETDFVPVGLVSSVPQVIVVQPAARAGRRLQGVPGQRAQEPGQAQLRLGRQRHLAPPGRRAVQAADQDLHHPHPVPRRRSGAAGPDRRPGRHDVRRPGLVGRAHQGRADQGAGRGLATDARRASPMCPPAAERAARYQVSTWYGLWAPKGTPKDVVERIAGRDAKAFDSEEIKGTGPASAPTPDLYGDGLSAASSAPRSSAGPGGQGLGREAGVSADDADAAR